jgi:mRNA interferase MazF
VELARGDIWWAELPEPRGSEPGYRRPLLIVQNDTFNRSRLQTTIAVVLTGNVRLVDAPGNVLVPARASGLPRDSVANVSQVVTVDRSALAERVGRLPSSLVEQVADGLRLTLAL